MVNSIPNYIPAKWIFSAKAVSLPTSIRIPIPVFFIEGFQYTPHEDITKDFLKIVFVFIDLYIFHYNIIENKSLRIICS